MSVISIVLAIVSIAGVGTSVYLYSKDKNSDKNENPKMTEDEAIKLSSEKAEEILDSAQSEADKIILKGKEKFKTFQEKADQLDDQLVQRETNLAKREKIVESKLRDVDLAKDEVESIKKNLSETRDKLETRLEKISGLSRDEARDKLKKEIEENLTNFKAKKIREAEKRIKEEADDKSKEILVSSMQKVATEYVGETTVTTVKLEDEKLKGRIIGREGRNIRAFEKATGVDVIVDESPDAIALSSFDPLRREIAAIAMKKLISDGRIHPGRIEEVVNSATTEVAKEVKESGQVLAEEADWPGIDLGLIKLLGKEKYRTSYGQSLMKHTIEVIRLGAALSQELNADVEMVKKACLLHDVGKVLSHKMEGAHHHLSGEVARKYNLPDKLVNAIEAHHLDIEPESLEAVIVYIADAISGARPGARKDSYESYIKRVRGIEDVAKKVAGNKASEIYAIHAGREVRVIVKPESIDDDSTVVLADDIAKEIEKSQTYPGTVQVTVIRESRAMSMAK